MEGQSWLTLVTAWTVTDRRITHMVDRRGLADSCTYLFFLIPVPPPSPLYATFCFVLYDRA